MNITIHPSKLSGRIVMIPSKSQAHRLLICAAFSDRPTHLLCAATNRDIEATVDCLNALGASIHRTEDGYRVIPVSKLPTRAELDCCESGSTLRFMLPIAGALGVDATFVMAGRLPQRPLSPLWEEMERMGCRLSRPTANTIHCSGKLLPGKYTIDGSVSSQFITGLLFALSLLTEESSLSITGKVESRPYIELTKQTLRIFGLDPDRPGSGKLHSPESLTVEGDWSNGAFFLAANAIGSSIHTEGLDDNSVQGDRAIKPILEAITQDACVVDAADIPDLVPILSVVAALCHGVTFQNIARLRIKESDRVASVCNMLTALGIHTHATENELTVLPGTFSGGVVDACNDHRIAMAAAIAATAASGDVIILGAECVKKSYPDFWEEYKRLGGSYEQHLRRKPEAFNIRTISRRSHRHDP